MAFNQNIAQEYNRNKILTASPAELTLMKELLSSVI